MASRNVAFKVARLRDAIMQDQDEFIIRDTNLGDAALVAHGTHYIRLSSIVIGLGVSSALYMYSIDKDRTLKSLPWLIGLVVCAIGLATSKD